MPSETRTRVYPVLLLPLLSGVPACADDVVELRDDGRAGDGIAEPDQVARSMEIPPRCEGGVDCCPADKTVKQYGDGNDFIHNFQNDVCIVAGGGNDTIQDFGAHTVIVAGPGDDTIQSYGAELIYGNGGHDVIQGSATGATVIPGPDGGWAQYLGNGTRVVVHDACELTSATVLQGGWNSTLVLPMSRDEAEDLGVFIQGFSEIVEQPSACASQCVAAPDCSGQGMCAEGVDPGTVACECEPGFTGPGCGIACPSGGECLAEVTRNPDGTASGVMMFHDVLYPTSVDDAVPGFEDWIRDHATTLGLAPMDASVDLDLSRVPSEEPRAFGKNQILSIEQRYRGLRIVGPGNRLNLTVSAGIRVISYLGTVVDPRVDLDGFDDPIGAEEAILAAYAWWGARGDDVADIVGADAAGLVAVPAAGKVAWPISLLLADGSATGIVMPGDIGSYPQGGPPPDPVVFRDKVLNAPPCNVGELTIHTKSRLDASPFDDPTDPETNRDIAQRSIPFDGMFTGSEFAPPACQGEVPPAACGQVQLSDERIAVYDAGPAGSSGEGDHFSPANMNVHTSQDCTFEAALPAAGRELTQDAYATAEGAMATLELTKSCRWDHYSAASRCTPPQVMVVARSGVADITRPDHNDVPGRSARTRRPPGRPVHGPVPGVGGSRVHPERLVSDGSDHHSHAERGHRAGAAPRVRPRARLPHRARSPVHRRSGRGQLRARCESGVVAVGRDGGGPHPHRAPDADLAGPGLRGLRSGGVRGRWGREPVPPHG